ncbi:MAG TPA: nickel-dependent lactate racemase [Nitrosopumilaceae archaeon]|nr:nickel-dependent lactate racemase [Nitrosopumilaceae archaeon]
MTTFKIPYGKEEISFEMPSGFNVTIAKSNPMPSISNVSESIKNALLNPINSKPLSELIKKDDSVCIIVTDITRSSPDKEILPLLVEQILEKTDPKNLTLLIASGLHREMTVEEKMEKYGEKIVKNFQIINHDAKNEQNLISLGTTKNGTPIKISKIAYNSDFLISIGVVEPHQYAGYSGGYKTLAIGVAGDETISKTHSRDFIEHKNSRIGNIDGNIFNEDIIEIGNKVGLDFIVNVILDDKKNIVNIKAGEPSATYKTLVTSAKKISETIITKSFDVAICGVGFPKDTNLYQTSRAASYLYYLPTRVVKNNGYIVIPATCIEGAGEGVGEQRFFEMLKTESLEQILDHKDDFKAGEQRAFMMANVLKYCNIIIVGSKKSQIVKDVKMIPASTMNEAFELIQNDLGKNLDVILLPNSLMTLPIIK